MQSLPFLLDQFIHAEKLFTVKDRLLVGVSGGLDSVVLVHLLTVAGYQVELAHMNYGLRGAESERDQDFVEQMANRLGVNLHTKRIDAVFWNDIATGNLQEQARELRYEWMEQLLGPIVKRQGARQEYIVTAHHANDQAETMLQHLFRGAGLRGLKGMQPARNRIRRPLLFAPRLLVETYAAEHGLLWVEDSTNLTDKYNRNRIRHHVLPTIEEHYPGVVNRLYATSGYLNGALEFVEQQTAQLLQRVIVKKGADQWLPINRWKQLPGKLFFLYEWLAGFGFSTEQVAEVQRLVDSQTGRYVQAGDWKLIRNRDWFVLTPATGAGEQWFSIDAAAGSISVGDKHLIWKTVDATTEAPPADGHIAWMDMREIKFPLLLRRWRTGDYFYPIGLNKKKKLARFLTDLKLSRTEKEATWVLETDKRICWVVGHRLDDRFKIRSSTSSLICFSWSV